MSIPQVLIKDKYCLTIDEAVAYFNMAKSECVKLSKKTRRRISSYKMV